MSVADLANPDQGASDYFCVEHILNFCNQTLESVVRAAGFAVVFVLAVFACGFVAWLAKKLIEAVGLRPADRALGALFGVLRGGLVLLAVAAVAAWTPLHEADWWQQSQVAPWMVQMLQGLRPALPEEFGRHLPS